MLKDITKTIVFALQLLTGMSLYGAKLVDFPVLLKQPDGTEFTSYLTGDEDFSYYHDGYDIIVRHPIYKYYVFAKINGNDLITTEQIAGIISGYNELEIPINKRDKKLSGYIFKDWMKPYNTGANNSRSLSQRSTLQKSRTPKVGNVNNIVIFVRFRDQRRDIEPEKRKFKENFKFYKSAYTYLNTYYKECSYDRLNVNSRFFGTDSELVGDDFIIDGTAYFKTRDIANKFINKLRNNNNNTITKYIYDQMIPEVQREIATSEIITSKILNEINRIVISNFKFYKENRTYLDSIITSAEVLNLLRKERKSNSEMEKLNRLLMSEVFPEDIDINKPDLTAFVYDTDYSYEDFAYLDVNPSGKFFNTYLSFYIILASAVEAVSEQINLTATDLDQNNDGYVDHITFIILGTPRELKESGNILYPHMDTFDRSILAQIFNTNTNVFQITNGYYNNMGDYITDADVHYPRLKNLELGTYNILIDGHMTSDVHVTESRKQSYANHTAVHEFFHSIGAPDLYRPNPEAISKYYGVVGFWDIMSGNPAGLPDEQVQMSAYMKWKYGRQYNSATKQYDSWIADAQWADINSSSNADNEGNNKTYTLTALASQDCREGTKYFYKIVPDINNKGEYFIIEYRKKIDTVSSDSDINNDTEFVKGNAGLLLYRINEGRNGRKLTSDYWSKMYIDGNKYGAPYEVYLFRNKNDIIEPRYSADIPNSLGKISYFGSDNISHAFTEISGFSVINKDNLDIDNLIKSQRYIYFSPFIEDKYYEEKLTENHFRENEIIGSGFKIYDIVINSDNTASFKVEYEKKNTKFNEKK